jgi:demethoxyubiquinone hydroxylase (CLK1/Coq7/Cat5 family)
MRIVLPMTAILFAAQATAVAQESERYRLEKTEDGYVRMDTASGEMSICTERAGQLVCRAADEERTALQEEIDRLAAKLEAVEERLNALESRGGAVSALPSEAEFEKSLGFMERFFRRFLDIVRDFDQEMGDEPADPQPQRT